MKIDSRVGEGKLGTRLLCGYSIKQGILGGLLVRVVGGRPSRIRSNGGGGVELRGCGMLCGGYHGLRR